MASLATIGKARVLVLDDEPLIREGLSAIINREHDLMICGQVATAENLYLAVNTAKPDLLTVDLGLANGEGLEVIRTLKLSHPRLPILVISHYDEMIYAERVLRAGASGYLLKQQGLDQVLVAIRAVLGGGLYFSPQVSALALRRLGQGRCELKNDTGQIGNLSNRELQVLELLGAGLGSRSIAEKLGLSVKTIEAHREHIKHKLGLTGTPQLLNYAACWRKEQGYHHLPARGPQPEVVALSRQGMATHRPQTNP
jgi:DNA-binding NarL/FixJ family response regulator